MRMSGENLDINNIMDISNPTIERIEFDSIEIMQPCIF